MLLVSKTQDMRQPRVGREHYTCAELVTVRFARYGLFLWVGWKLEPRTKKMRRMRRKMKTTGMGERRAKRIREGEGGACSRWIGGAWSRRIWHGISSFPAIVAETACMSGCREKRFRGMWRIGSDESITEETEDKTGRKILQLTHEDQIEFDAIIGIWIKRQTNPMTL